MTPAELRRIPLRRVHQEDPSSGVTLIELVSLLAGEDGSSYPPRTVCPVIAAFAHGVNAAIHDDQLRETILRPCAEAMLGTAGNSELERSRSFECVDSAVRVFVPLKLEASGMARDAAKLRAVEPVTDRPSALAAVQALRSAEHAFKKRGERGPKIECIEAGNLISFAAQPWADCRLIASRAASVLEVESRKEPFAPEAKERLWRSAAELIQRLSALGVQERIAHAERKSSWSLVLAHLRLDKDSDLRACRTDEQLESWWKSSLDGISLLRLYLMTPDRPGLVRAAAACVRTSLRYIPEARRVQSLRLLEVVDGWVRGELNDLQAIDARLEILQQVVDADTDAESFAMTAAIMSAASIGDCHNAVKAAKEAARAHASVHADDETQARADLADVVRSVLSSPSFDQLGVAPH